jgi:hypothetical protein
MWIQRLQADVVDDDHRDERNDRVCRATDVPSPRPRRHVHCPLTVMAETKMTPRKAELEARLGTAALRYFEVTGLPLFIFPVANTTPQVFVAAGEYEALVNLLTSGPPTTLPG